MKKIGLFLFGISLLCACEFEPKFKVEGSVAGADGKMLYLEFSGMEGVTVLDSIKLKTSGEFNFKQPQPESPEFYRLRVDEKIINFSTDSTETIQIKANYENFSSGYEVEGSLNSSRIKELTLMQIRLQENVSSLIKKAQSNQINYQIFEDSLASLIRIYKDNVKINYIYAAPNVASSYFALFQSVNNYLIFDPLNSKEDIKCFAAVATSLNNSYPHADRSKNIYNLVIKGMKNTRTRKETTIDIPQDKINQSGLIDIKLKDIKGTDRKLTDLRGKVVLLDFTVYQSTVSTAHNFMLRELYNKYAALGLEIYQVSLDADEHFWKTSADNLPWVCVRDPNGVYSNHAAHYNVKQLPTYFLINKNNELSARDETIKNLEEEIKKLL